MIARRVEYIRYCDVEDCHCTEAADWKTRQEAETAADADGWLRLTYKRWMCPGCKEKHRKNGLLNER